MHRGMLAYVYIQIIYENGDLHAPVFCVVCLTIYIPISLSIHLSFFLSNLSTQCICIYLPANLPIYLFVYLSVQLLHIQRSVRRSIYLSVDASI